MKHYPITTGPVFDDQSPMRRLPAALNTPQRRFLEAIGAAVEMAQLSHHRLRGALSTLSLSYGHADGIPHGLNAPAFLDAWTLVDSLHRLRELLAAMPKMKRKTPLLRILAHATEHVESLRNRVQHIKGELHGDANAALPVWGTIGWLWVRDQSLSHFLSGILTLGPDVGNVRQIEVPNNRVFHDQLDHITVSVGTAAVNISEAMRIVVRVSRAMEGSLRPQFDGTQPLPLVDTVMIMQIVTDDAPGRDTGAA